ncbi:hypothetical protein POM88_049756 [Heracleum sosnowskyi]|uniref:Uncharacterized protein n=1 Tax=Heracleum sosnowskyi TaxID=360622 RepID=A0AAD8GYT5_9APIA|nr:hypothetical protein POM88_049756 [Heracleum sosnowskyi]
MKNTNVATILILILIKDSSYTPYARMTLALFQLSGQTMKSVDADATKFPVMLKFGVKKSFKFIISITRENVKEGSNVYTTSEICGPLEISDTNSPNMNKVPMLSPNESSNTKGESPATSSSTNKTRPRLTEEFNDPKEIHPLKNVKIEKV